MAARWHRHRSRAPRVSSPFCRPPASRPPSALHGDSTSMPPAASCAPASCRRRPRRPDVHSRHLLRRRQHPRRRGTAGRHPGGLATACRGDPDPGDRAHPRHRPPGRISRMVGRDLSAEGNGLTPPIYSKSLMKRVLASLLTMVALAACAWPLAKAETPEQALGAAAQRASQLHSAKFDLTGNVKMTFPPQLGAMFGQSGTSAGSLALDMTGNGEAQFPDRYHATINAKLAGLSVPTEVVVANGKAYVKNPMTGKWESSAQGGLSGQLSQPDPLSYEQLLRNVKSIKDLGETKLADGTT